MEPRSEQTQQRMICEPATGLNRNDGVVPTRALPPTPEKMAPEHYTFKMGSPPSSPSRGSPRRVSLLDSPRRERGGWDFGQEKIEVQYKIKRWLQCRKKTHPMLSVDWIKLGPPNYDIDNQMDFCEPEFVRRVFQGKEIFNVLGGNELNQARSRANCFEKIKSAFFMNRAALKMAEIDVNTDYSFSKIDENPNFAYQEGPFYFADVCAGPGGFTEYILWRKQWLFKGFGFTLQDIHDFRLEDSQCVSAATFQPLYGPKGNGDVRDPENIMDFKNRVMHETDGEGVHFMMSDGGFSVEGNEDKQEILSKKIYISQCLLALEVVRPHGNFVTKMFDVYTPFSVGLIYLMHLCFTKVAIMKPNTSRPANSERYFICQDLKDDEKLVCSVRDHIWMAVQYLWTNRNNEQNDVVELVPIKVMKNDKYFYEYICYSNKRLAESQIIALQKLEAFCRNPMLVEHRQRECRINSMDYWEIPDIVRNQIRPFRVETLFTTLEIPLCTIWMCPREVTLENFNDEIGNLEDWHFAPLSSLQQNNKCAIFAAVDLLKVVRWENRKWTKVPGLQLPYGTVVYGEIVKETLTISDTNLPITRTSLHIIDAIRLGDTFLYEMYYTERMHLIKTFCKAVNREVQEGYDHIRVRPKPLIPLTRLTAGQEMIQSSNSVEGNFMSLPVLGYQMGRETVDVNSILFLKTGGRINFMDTYNSRLQHFLFDFENERRINPISNLTAFIEQRINES